MSKLTWCQHCPSEILKYEIRQAKVCTRKRVGDHNHFGHEVFKYGVCSRFHYTKLEKLKPVWSTCSTCSEKEAQVAKQKEYLSQKARLKKQQVPSYLRDELDRFKEKMERRLAKKFERRFRIELERKVAEEVGRHLRTIREESRIEHENIQNPRVSAPPSLPSELTLTSGRTVDDATLTYSYSMHSDETPLSNTNSWAGLASSDESDYVSSSLSVRPALDFDRMSPVPPPSPIMMQRRMKAQGLKRDGNTTYSKIVTHALE